MQDTENKPTLEECFANLEELIGKLEDPQIPLEQAFELYKKGLDEVKSANSWLDTIEKTMLVMNADGQLEEFQE